MPLRSADRHGHYNYVERYYFDSCVVIVMFNTKLDDFNLCKFELSTIYDLFEDVVCKQNELH